MLYLFHGIDIDKARRKRTATCAALLAKAPDALVIRVGAQDVTPALLESLAHAQGLFSRRQIVFLDHVFSDLGSRDMVLKHLDALAASENMLLALEGFLSATALKPILVHTEKSEVFSGKDEKKGPSFDVFSLADALGRKDKKVLWTLYQEAQRHDLAPEEMHGVFFWKVKTMLLAQKTKSPEESGLSPFVFKKALAHARTFGTKELMNLSQKLMTLYHDARRGRSELSTGLERLILEL